MAFARDALGIQLIDFFTPWALYLQRNNLTLGKQFVADAAVFARDILRHAIALHKKCDSLRAACDHGNGALAKRMEWSCRR